jgi:oligopeptide/dipeptide ABC transporter ATP-binding protein
MTSLNPLFTIGAQMDEMFTRHMGASRREARGRTLESLRSVRIPAPEARVRAYPHEFSGGMRQRVSIGMNVASTPKLLICDEPTTALDVTVQLQILSLLREAQRASGMAIILVTHDLSNVAHFCDDVAVMYGGRIIESGPVAEVFAKPGHPYTEGLLEAMPSIEAMAGGGAPPDALRVIPGQAPSLANLPPGCRFAPRCGEAEPLCQGEYPDWFATPDDRRRVACWHTPGRMR